jgi:hypothetical protein
MGRMSLEVMEIVLGRWEWRSAGSWEMGVEKCREWGTWGFLQKEVGLLLYSYSLVGVQRAEISSDLSCPQFLVYMTWSS